MTRSLSDYVAIDCEMVITTKQGFASENIALARVAVVDHDGKVVYESFVHVHPDCVEDYCTKSSGVRAWDLADGRSGSYFTGHLGIRHFTHRLRSLAIMYTDQMHLRILAVSKHSTEIRGRPGESQRGYQGEDCHRSCAVQRPRRKSRQPVYLYFSPTLLLASCPTGLTDRPLSFTLSHCFLTPIRFHIHIKPPHPVNRP
jgi:hypothetical protein